MIRAILAFLFPNRFSFPCSTWTLVQGVVLDRLGADVLDGADGNTSALDGGARRQRISVSALESLPSDQLYCDVMRPLQFGTRRHFPTMLSIRLDDILVVDIRSQRNHVLFCFLRRFLRAAGRERRDGRSGALHRRVPLRERGAFGRRPMPAEPHEAAGAGGGHADDVAAPLRQLVRLHALRHGPPRHHEGDCENVLSSLSRTSSLPRLVQGFLSGLFKEFEELLAQFLAVLTFESVCIR